MTISRREFMQWAGAASAAGTLSMVGCAGTGSGPSAGRVVVIGGGMTAVDAAVQSGATSVYVEIMSKHGIRVPAPVKAPQADDAAPESEA